MATVTDLITDKTIRTAAVAAGCADASVVRYVERRPFSCTGDPVLTEQAWFLLSVKHSVDADFQVIGRRRTKAELMGLIRRC